MAVCAIGLTATPATAASKVDPYDRAVQRLASDLSAMAPTTSYLDQEKAFTRFAKDGRVAFSYSNGFVSPTGVVPGFYTISSTRGDLCAAPVLPTIAGRKATYLVLPGTCDAQLSRVAATNDQTSDRALLLHIAGSIQRRMGMPPHGVRTAPKPSAARLMAAGVEIDKNYLTVTTSSGSLVISLPGNTAAFVTLRVTAGRLTIA